MGGCAERCFRPASANARRLTMAALAARRSGEVQRYAVYGADVADTDSIVAAGLACIAGQRLPDAVIANAGISRRLLRQQGRCRELVRELAR